MKKLLTKISFALVLATMPFSPVAAQNQTEITTPVLSEDGIPFGIEIDLASFSLPTGLQAFASAIYKGKWIIIAGRTNGLHGFDAIGNNFPPSFQNTSVYVIDPSTGISISRSLTEPSSGLTITQIDQLSATKSEFFQKGSTLYLVGGYGINSLTNLMETKNTLTAIDLKKLVKWVKKGQPGVNKAIRQVSHPLLQVTGGSLFQNNSHDSFLLTLGQNFMGLYRPDSNGQYTQQIRSFRLVDEGKNLAIIPTSSSTTYPDYRRRDLNVVPILRNNKPAYVALSGVFTIQGGIWTVPITIKPDGSSFEPNPNAIGTFKQGMNNYNCGEIGLYSTRHKEMYIVLPGGLSYGYFSGGVFLTDEEIPFINQVTTIKIDKNDHYSQHLMNNEFPFLVSTGSNPGNQLLFGTEAQFFVKDNIALYQNGVIQLDKIEKPTIVGYIVGGIMSTVPNTSTSSDSTSSPYVFTVRVIPK